MKENNSNNKINKKRLFYYIKLWAYRQQWLSQANLISILSLWWFAIVIYQVLALVFLHPLSCESFVPEPCILNSSRPWLVGDLDWKEALESRQVHNQNREDRYLWIEQEYNLNEALYK